MAANRTTAFDLRRYGAAVERHAHDHHQIVLGLEGRLEMEIGGRDDAVSGSRAGVVTAGLDHSFAAEHPERFLVVDLPTASDGNARFWSEAAERPFVAVDDDLRGFCRVVAEAAGHGLLQGLHADMAGALLLDALARARGLETEPMGRPLARALAFMESHLAEPVTIAAVAAAAGLSESRLHALFLKRYDVAPGRYLARLRIARARDLLATGEASLAEIAFATGYSDQSAFTRAFRRETGETPAAFRRKLRHRER